MIKNLKYRLSKFIKDRRVRIGGMSMVTAITFAAVTLLGSPIRTIEMPSGRLYHIDLAYAGMPSKFLTQKVEDTTVFEQEPETFPVYVTCADKTVSLEFEANRTVADALQLAGYAADQNDFVEPSLDTVITGIEYIDFAKVDYVTGTYEKSVPYSTKVVYTSKHNKGYSKVTQAGKKGSERVTYTEKIVNGVSKGKTVTETETLKAPTNAVKVVGTKVAPSKVKTSAGSNVKTISTLTPAKSIKLDKNGNPVNYKSKRVVRATAYTYTGNNCSTGVAPQPGYIAVNPKVIPYGTKMYIKSPNGKIIYGYAVAADTGGFIRNYPTGIDLFMTTESACVNFGVRNMEVYILE